MRIVGQTDISAIFGVAPKTITEWQSQGMPVAVQGGPGIPSEYESDDCIRWLVSREVSKIQGESPKDRLDRLKGDQIEFEMAKERRQYIPADEIAPVWEGAVLQAREFLVGEPGRVANLCVGRDRAQIAELLTATFDGFLARLAQSVSIDDESSDADDEGEEELE
ncbi:phage terminase Nu1 subunit (DNA packaging protein) [Comamonas sp. BIGb0124]|uniref:terminase small subunit n=1 Tax=Comamonas sp. BIGb0124 TaxID=2485130 RepID=UPI000F4724F4|nr:terminase small subunit [Comamonas sp. BIGb0124]ROR25149.1 phage terminase Nu1 subunit (DNA packaging protein) [Comamonas sp. BIGb0124]